MTPEYNVYTVKINKFAIWVTSKFYFTDNILVFLVIYIKYYSITLKKCSNAMPLTVWNLFKSFS